MNKLLILLILVLAIFASVTTAGSIIGSSCDANSDSIKAREECAQETKYNSWSNLASDSCNFVMENIKESSAGYKELQQPGSQLKATKNKMTVIASALVMFALTAAGLMYIASSTDPKKRTKSKSMLIAAMYMMIFVGAAHYISNLTFDAGIEAASMVETNIQGFINEDPWRDLISEPPDTDIEGEDDDIADAYGRFSSILSVAPLFILSGWSYILTMYLRNMIVALLTVAAPIIVVLFFFHPTKTFGVTLLSLYVVELFIPVFLFPGFKVAEILMSASNSAGVKVVIMAAALAVSVVLHVIMAGVAIVKGSSWKGEE